MKAKDHSSLTITKKFGLVYKVAIEPKEKSRNCSQVSIFYTEGPLKGRVMRIDCKTFTKMAEWFLSTTKSNLSESLRTTKWAKEYCKSRFFRKRLWS